MVISIFSSSHINYFSVLFVHWCLELNLNHGVRSGKYCYIILKYFLIMCSKLVYRPNMMVTLTTTITRTDIMMSIHMSPKCLTLLKSFCSTLEMPLMKEWYTKCKIYMKTRKFILKVPLCLNYSYINILF